MNVKVVLTGVLALLAIVAILSIFITSQHDFTVDATVEGCAVTGNASNVKKSFNEVEPKIKVDGNQVVYSRAISHLCCRKVRIEHEIEDSKISIYENWSGVGCKCICFSKITVKVNRVPAGEYVVSVYKIGTTPAGEKMEKELIMSRKVVVK